MNAYMSEPSRICVVKQYLFHESKKQKTLAQKTPEVGRRMPERHAKAYSEFVELQGTEVQGFLDQRSYEDLYILFHSVSKGAFQKELWNCVGVPTVNWVFERCPIRMLVFESPVGPLNEQFKGLNRISMDSAMSFLRALPNSRIIDAERNYGSDSDIPRSEDPLIGTAEGNDVVVNDGNGRLLRMCSRLINRQSELETVGIWVGRARMATLSELRWIEEMSPHLFPKCLTPAASL